MDEEAKSGRSTAGPTPGSSLSIAVPPVRPLTRALTETRLLQTLLDDVPDCVFFKDSDGRFARVSRAVSRLFGLRDPNEALGRTDADFFTPQYAQQARADEQQVMRSGLPYVNHVEPWTLLDGRVIWSLTTRVPVLDEAGHPIGTIVLSRDVSSLQKMKDQFEAESELLWTLIDSLPDHIYVKDAQGRFLAANAALRESLAVIGREQIVGKCAEDFLPARQAAASLTEERQIIRGGQPSLNREESIQDVSGRQRWVLRTRVPLRDPNGVHSGLVGIDRDISERKQSEQELRRAHAALARREQELTAALADLTRSHEDLLQTQLQLIQAAKMESMGLLAAGTAHEVKNPLTVIAAGVEYLSKCDAVATDGEVIQRVLSDMSDAVRRADDVVRGLLRFSLPQTLKLADADLNAVIEQSLQMVKHELVRAHVTLATELAGNLPAVAIDPPKIQQVLVNLFMNAIQAMPRGGQMTVSTSLGPAPAQPDPPGASVGTTPDGDAVVAQVQDTGQGIPQDKLAKIFDAFFTLKGSDGAGMGLTVVRKIIELHGAMLQIANRPQGGVKATLVFKAADGGHHE